MDKIKSLFGFYTPYLKKASLAAVQARDDDEIWQYIWDKALYDSILADDIIRVRDAIAHDANPNSVSFNYGMPLLHVAVHIGNLEVIKMLLDAGADVNITEEPPYNYLTAHDILRDKMGITRETWNNREPPEIFLNNLHIKKILDEAREATTSVAVPAGEEVQQPEVQQPEVQQPAVAVMPSHLRNIDSSLRRSSSSSSDDDDGEGRRKKKKRNKTKGRKKRNKKRKNLTKRQNKRAFY